MKADTQAHRPHAQRFSEAAGGYDDHARIQKQSARFLWDWTREQLQPGFEPKACLDIGSGTGYMTRLLLDHYPHSPVHAVDIAPGMIDTLRGQLQPQAGERLHLHCMDGEELALEHLWVPNQSLLVSNMCAQWFEQLGEAVRHWLSISNVVAFSVLVDGSFEAWKQAHLSAKQACGLRQLPQSEDLEHLLDTLRAEGLCVQTEFTVREYLEQHSGGLSFARSLRAIGADHARAQHRPANLRKVLAELGDICTLNHRIAYLYLRRA